MCVFFCLLKLVVVFVEILVKFFVEMGGIICNFIFFVEIDKLILKFFLLRIFVYFC